MWTLLVSVLANDFYSRSWCSYAPPFRRSQFPVKPLSTTDTFSVMYAFLVMIDVCMFILSDPRSSIPLPHNDYLPVDVLAMMFIKLHKTVRCITSGELHVCIHKHRQTPISAENYKKSVTVVVNDSNMRVIP